MRHTRPSMAILVFLFAGMGAGLVHAGTSPVHRTRVLAEVDSLHQARSVSRADSLLNAELIAAEEADDDAYALELLVRRGRLLTSFGQSASAVPVLEEAMGLAEDRRDSLNLARATRWLSLAQGIQGRQEEAGALYRKLLDIAVARGDSLHEGWARVGMGWQALNRGFLEEARAHYERAVQLFRGIDDPDAEIWARNGYALVLQRQGDFPAALDLYRELTAVAQGTGNTIVEAMACNNTGSLLHKLGDPGAAVPHYERARELQLAIQQPREAIIPALNIAVCMIEQDHLEDAVALLAELDLTCQEDGFPDLRADVLYELARVRGAQNRLDDAVVLHREIAAIPAERPVGSHVRNITGLARILAEMDSLDVALAVVESGRAEWLTRTAGGERLMLDSAWGERLADAGREDDALRVLDGVAREAAQSGMTGYRISSRTCGGEIHLAADRPDSALAWLNLAAAAWEDERDVPLDPRWREQRGNYGQLIYPRLVDLLLRKGADPVTAHAAAHRFKARTLLESMLGPGRRDGAPDGEPATPSDILRVIQSGCLEPGELFLDYYLGPDASFVFAATPEQIRVSRLPALDEWSGLLANYRDALEGGGGEAAGARVSRLVLSGVEDLLTGSDAILWSPDGPLHRIPLSNLTSSGVVLAESHTITRVPSASALCLLRETPHASVSPPRILAVAGSRGATGARLTGPAREVRGLENRFVGVQALIDPRPEELLSLDSWSVLHVAAHTDVDVRHPWRSAIQLASGLSAGEIARGRVPVEMAVLSSCESVGSRSLAGEGQLGLSSAFLAAGVPTVIATLWPVSDRAGLAFADSFYESLATGDSVEQALQRTRLAMRDDPDPARRIAWSAFVLVGDGDRSFELERRPKRVPWLVFVGMAAIVAIGWVRWRSGLREA